jgi:hypothetical protein
LGDAIKHTTISFRVSAARASVFAALLLLGAGDVAPRRLASEADSDVPAEVGLCAAARIFTKFPVTRQ